MSRLLRRDHALLFIEPGLFDFAQGLFEVSLKFRCHDCFSQLSTIFPHLPERIKSKAS